MRKKLLLIIIGVFCVAYADAQWQSVGPYGGIVKCFDTIGTTIFAGTDGAGVLQSTNNGASWSGVSTGITNLQVYSLAHSGTAMIAGTYGGGVFKSTNNGGNWTAINTGLTNSAVNAVAISGNAMYAGTSATNGGIFVSTDGGANWTLSNNGLPAGVYVLSIAVSGTIVYIGTGNGVFMSANNGGNWTAINTGLTNLYVNAIAANGSTLYAGTNIGVFQSLNNGSNWSLVHSSGLVTSIIINGASVFSGWGATGGLSGGVDLSTNNGSLWTAAYSGAAVWAVGMNGTTVFAGTNGDGVYSSTDNGNNWTQTSVGINNINTPTILLSTGTTIFAGAFLGGVFLTTNNGTTWNQMNSGLTNTAVQVLGANGSTVFAGTSGSGGGVFSSINNGGNWTLVNNGLTNNDVTSFAINGTKTFAGTFGGGVFLSNNYGGLWSPVNTGLSNTSVQALAANGSTLFAGTFYGGVFISTNDGSSWTQTNSGLGNLNVNALATNGTAVFAGTYGGVFSSTNNGTAWTAKNNGLTNLSVVSIATSGAYVFAGTDGGGVFFSCDTGNTWTAINDGLFSNAIQSLAIADSNVFAATQGGAVFRRPLSEIMRVGVAIAQTAGTNPTCENAAVTFTATPQCGGCPASYQWKVNGVNVGIDSSSYTTTTLTNGQVVSCVLTSNLPGIYNNPATSNSFTVSVTPAPPTPTISQNGTVLTSSATSGNQWYLDGTLISGATSQTYTINQNGNYTVIATIGSCSSDTSATLTINSAFTVDVSIAQTGGTNPSCYGESVTFTATPVNGGSSPSYIWLINGSPVGTDSPTYTTTTLTSGQVVSCLLTSSMIGVSGNPATSNSLWITVNNPPSAPTITQNGATLTSSVSSGNQWYLNGSIISGATNQTYTATQNGTYTVTVTVNGCTSAASAPVTVSGFLSVSVTITQTSGTNPACAGASVTFTAAPTNGGSGPTYQWQVDGTNVSGATNATYTTSALTNGQAVTCIVTSNMPGVTNNPATSNTITMTINSTPAPTISQSGLVLTSSSTTGNQWYLDGTIITGATGQTYTVTQNGTYTVTATVNGCTSSASSPVVISGAFTASVTIAQTAGTNPMCEGSAATFTATPVNGGTSPIYQWQINGANVGTNSTAYTTTTLTNNQVVTCMLFSSMPGVLGNPATSNAITMTVNSLPPTPTITQNGTLLTSSATGVNQWSFNGSPISDAFGQSYTASQNGSYTVTVTVNGCSSTSAPFNVVNIGIDELNNDYFFTVYPNPNDGNFTISFQANVKAVYKLELKNALGQSVYNETLTAYNGTFSKMVNISEYGKGVYILSLITPDNITICKRISVY